MVVSFGRKGRWVIALLLMLSSLAAYYMDEFGVIMDVVMIDNMINTDVKEVEGLLSIGMIIRIMLLGILPAWLVLKHWPEVRNIRAEIKNRIKWILILVVTLIGVILPFTAGYTSFIREHKITRFYANPTYSIYSLIKYAGVQLSAEQSSELSKMAEDAKFVGPSSRHELVIMVVGETARADRFSLNGYHKKTNPLLAKEDVISFSNVLHVERLQGFLCLACFQH